MLVRCCYRSAPPAEIRLKENKKVDTYVNFDEAETENENPEDDEIETESSANSSPQKGVLKKIANAPVNLIKSGVHSAASKINPFDKKISQNDTTDSGVESIRLANTVVKKTGQTIKTVDRTVKTTQRTIKTAENVVSVTGRAIIKTGRTAGKVRNVK